MRNSRWADAVALGEVMTVRGEEVSIRQATETVVPRLPAPSIAVTLRLYPPSVNTAMDSTSGRMISPDNGLSEVVEYLSDATHETRVSVFDYAVIDSRYISRNVSRRRDSRRLVHKLAFEVASSFIRFESERMPQGPRVPETDTF